MSKKTKRIKHDHISIENTLAKKCQKAKKDKMERKKGKGEKMSSLKNIKKEMQEEIDMCSTYILKHNFTKEWSEDEMVAMHIIASCMQTLESLMDNELRELEKLRKNESEF